MNLENCDAEEIDEILYCTEIDLEKKICNKTPRLDIESCLESIANLLQVHEGKIRNPSDIDRAYMPLLHESIRQLSYDHEVYHNTKECKELFRHFEELLNKGYDGLEIGMEENRDFSSAPRQFQELINDPLLFPLVRRQKRSKQISELSAEIGNRREEKNKESKLINLGLHHKVTNSKRENYLWIVEGGEVVCHKSEKENHYIEFELAYGLDHVLSVETSLNKVRDNKKTPTRHPLTLPLDPSEFYCWNLEHKEPKVAATQIIDDDWKEVTLGRRNNLLFEIFTLLQLEQIRQESGSKYVLLKDFFDNLHFRGVFTGSPKDLANYSRQVERGKKKKNEQDFFVNKSNFFEIRKLPECQIFGLEIGCCDDSRYVMQFQPNLRLAVHETRMT